MRTKKPIVLILILFPLLVFWQTRGFDFVWDDEVNVARNPSLNPVTAANVIRFWQAPYERLYIPISYTVWAVIAPFAGLDGGRGLNPAPYHAANMVFHILSVLVVFAILKILVRWDWAACAGALLFALHPVQVEAVAWITGMKDVFSGFLALLAVWQYLCYASAATTFAEARVGKRGKPRVLESNALNANRKALRHYTAATLAFVFALLAKPTAAVTPLVAGFLDFFVLKRSLKQSAMGLGGWIVVALPFIVLTKLVQPDADVEFVPPLWARLLVAADAAAFYLYKLAAPLWLAPDYGRLPQWVLRQGWVYFIWMVPCALALLVWSARDKRPWLLAASAIFFVAILPVSGLMPFSFQNVSTVADRYLYLAMMGPALALGWLLSEYRSARVTLICSLVLAVLGIKSAWQTGYWRDDATLFRHALSVNPNSWTAHYSLARALVRQGKNDEAIAPFREAVRLQPEFTNAHFSLGSLLVRRGETEAGIEAYRRALKIAPDFVDARYGLANALALRGEQEAALEEYRQALKVSPNRGDIRFSMGNLLARKGDLAEAAESYRRVIEIRPDFAPAHVSLGRVRAAQGDLAQATNHFRQALRIDPRFAEAHESLALALAQQGKIAEAARHSQEAQRLKQFRSAQPGRD